MYCEENGMKLTVTDEPFALGFINEPSPCMTKKIAAGQKAAYKEMTVSVDTETGLPDCACNGLGVWHCYGFGLFCNRDHLRQKAENNPEHRDEYMYLLEKFEPYISWEASRNAFSDEERDMFDGMGGWGGTWIGHAVPNLINIAVYGTVAMRDTVLSHKEKNPGKEDFYDGLLIYLDAVDELAKRVREAIDRTLPTADENGVRKLTRLKKTFENCPEKPAVTFADACGVYVMLFTNDGIDSPGHFDQYMIDFYRNSDKEESLEMLDDMWEFFHKTRTWNLCIGGSDENGRDLTNELTFDILEVTARKGYNTPNLTMRRHKNTPKELLYSAAKCIGTGCGMPVIYNDEVVCPALERLGIPPCDSHLYVMNGCNQIDIQGKSHMGLEDGEVNLGKAVELVFSQGVCQVTGKKFGIDTGDPAEFDTFEKFYDAVSAQIRHLADLACSMSNKAQELYSRITGNPLRSLTIEGCLEKGLDYKCGGPLYGHGQILAEGVADCIDSVAAVKKYVYEDKKYTIKEMADAVNSDFAGNEDMSDFLRRSPLRFGNDNEYVDAVAKDIIDSFNTYLETKTTWRGGFFGGGCSPFTRAANNGKSTGALPSGKRLREPMYADSIGASPGRDVNGPTALLNSCLNFDHTLPTSGFVLNVKFDKVLFNTEKGMNAFISLINAYFEGGGQQISVTVVSRDELLDAKVHPERHRDLIVRVGGYSDYFVNLPPELQDNVIARTDYEL